MERALTCAGEAITLSEKTQNKHLQARTHVWRGLTLLRAGRGNYREAFDCCERGKLLLEPRGRSYAAEELQLLEQELESGQTSMQLGVVPSHGRPEAGAQKLISDGRCK
jgi:hypothetical protein